MSREPIAPHVVDVDDNAIRRAAALTAVKAYSTAPHMLLVMVAGAVLLVATTGPSGSWPARLATGFGYLAYLLATFAAAVGVYSYFLPKSRTRQLWFVRTSSGAAATLQTRPDRRRSAQPGDVHAASFGAWPKRTGAGRLLGDHVRDTVQTDGGRLTATATPLLAPTYRRHGLVDDGRTAGIMVQLATRPRTEEDEALGATDGGESQHV